MKFHPDAHFAFTHWINDPALKPFVWLLMKRLQEGHVCVDLSSILAEDTSALFDGIPNLEVLTKPSPYVGTGDDIKPFIYAEGKLYLQRYYQYETRILASVKRLLDASLEQRTARQAALLQHADFIKALSAPVPPEASSPNERYDWQLAAAISASLHSIQFITGGPGTGKTTTVAKLLAILYETNPALRVSLAAPTGKAAMRMAESLKTTRLALTPSTREKFQELQPSTIHRLLGTKRNSIYFKHDASHPLPLDVLIVDEASMIDMPLFAKLIDALPAHARVVFLGDRHQLASVEAGSLLGDFCESIPYTNGMPLSNLEIINSFIVDPGSKIPITYSRQDSHPLLGHIIELQLSRRFQSDGGIGRLSKTIIGNETEQISSFLPPTQDPAVTIDTSYRNDTLEHWVDGYAAVIAETDLREALRKMNQFRVLVAVREGPQGLYALNQRMEQRLMARKLIRKSSGFYAHQPIMITQNNAALDLYNGDTGLIRMGPDNKLRAYFEDSNGEIRSVIPGYLQSVETVYAMTIHKSQGSEYDQVLVILPNQEDLPLLTRELLYTAITRAKKHVTIQATESVLRYTMQQQVNRASGIPQRIHHLRSY